MSNTVGEEEKIPRNFITDIIDEDLKEGRTDHVATDFLQNQMAIFTSVMLNQFA